MPIRKLGIITGVLLIILVISVGIVSAAPAYESSITVDRSGSANSTRTVDRNGVTAYLKIVDFYRFLESPSSYAFGNLAESSTGVTGLTYFTITNKSTVAITITTSGSDMTGGTTWTLSDTATPGINIYGLKAGLEGADYIIIVKKTAPYNTLVASLGVGATQRWGLKIWAPTTIGDGTAKSGTVTLTVTVY